MGIVKDNYANRKLQQKKERNSREAAWRALTPVQQLAELDRRLGDGLGASKQRNKIAALIEKQKQPKEKKEKEHKNANATPHRNKHSNKGHHKRSR